jgi:hypothetical protein
VNEKNVPPNDVIIEKFKDIIYAYINTESEFSQQYSWEFILTGTTLQLLREFKTFFEITTSVQYNHLIGINIMYDTNISVTKKRCDLS